MKLILAVVQDADTDRVLKEFIGQKQPVTQVGSTGGFLQQGNTTLLIGVADDKVNGAIDTLRRTCQNRTAFMPVAAAPAPNSIALYNYIEVQVGGAVVFVLDVEHFAQF